MTKRAKFVKTAIFSVEIIFDVLQKGLIKWLPMLKDKTCSEENDTVIAKMLQELHTT